MVGIVAAEGMGLGAEREFGLESELRGSTAPSVSWFTSADMSMVGDSRVCALTFDCIVYSRS